MRKVLGYSLQLVVGAYIWIWVLALNAVVVAMAAAAGS